MPPSILLVDDDPLLVQLMGAMLEDLGRIRFATDGKGALQQVAAEPPDVILLDGEMPLMDGFEVSKALKSSSQFGDIPVIFVTAHSDEAFELRCFDAGAADFIVKPVSRPVLRARVQTQLRLKQASDALGRLAVDDALTGLGNRRAFDALLARAVRHALREASPLGMVMIDVDGFSQYNDLYGRAAGDACLARVAHALQGALLRPHDTLARHGGDTFAVLLPDVSADGVRVVAERLLAAVLALRIVHAHGGSGGLVSISLGGAVMQPPACPGPVSPACPDDPRPAEGARALVERAGQALYAARQHGPGGICVAGPGVGAQDDGAVLP